MKSGEHSPVRQYGVLPRLPRYSGDLVRDKGDLRGQDHQVRPAERRPTLPEREAAAEIVIRGGARVLGLEAEAVQPDVILEVSPHAREVDDGVDAELLEVSLGGRQPPFDPGSREAQSHIPGA